MVWNRSRESTWSAFAPSPATPIISMKSMNPWVALPGRCRLSSVTSARQPSRSPLAIHSTALRSNSGSGPCSPNWRGPPSSRDRWPVPMIATRWSAGHDSTSCADGPAELHEPLRLRQRRREDVGVDRHDRQVGLGPQRDDRAGDAVVDAQLVAERQVEVGVQAVAQDVRGQVLLALRASSAAGRTRAPRCTSWRRRTAPCRPGTAACCPATAGGSGRCRPSPARRAGPW